MKMEYNNEIPEAKPLENSDTDNQTEVDNNDLIEACKIIVKFTSAYVKLEKELELKEINEIILNTTLQKTKENLDKCEIEFTKLKKKMIETESKGINEFSEEEELMAAVKSLEEKEAEIHGKLELGVSEKQKRKTKESLKKILEGMKDSDIKSLFLEDMKFHYAVLLSCDMQKHQLLREILSTTCEKKHVKTIIKSYIDCLTDRLKRFEECLARMENIDDMYL